MKKTYVTFEREGAFVASYPLGGSYKMGSEVLGTTVRLQYFEVELCGCGSPEHTGECAA